jgi:hypothetical protein
MCVCMYACMCVCMHVCMDTHMHIQTHTHTHTSSSANLVTMIGILYDFMYAFVMNSAAALEQEYGFVCVHVCMHVCMDTRMPQIHEAGPTW